MSLLRVRPTRGFYLELKRNITYLEEGYKLLKMKRDELVKELRNSLKRLSEVRKEVDELIEEALKEYFRIYALLGEEEIKKALANFIEPYEVKILPVSVMGVYTPRILSVKKPNIEGKYTPPLQSLANKFLKLLEKLLEVAELEARIDSVSSDLEHTNRTVNSLEKIILPDLKATLKYIEDVLEEEELDEFTKLKMIRNKIVARRTR